MQQRYDLSEFGPNEKSNDEYDLSEFGPSVKDNSKSSRKAEKKAISKKNKKENLKEEEQESKGIFNNPNLPMSMKIMLGLMEGGARGLKDNGGKTPESMMDLNTANVGVNPSDYGEALSERAQGIGRGFTDIGEGLKQLYLNKTNPEEAENYRRQVEQERKFYKGTPAGKEPISKFLRSQTAELPAYALMGGGLGASRSLLGQMLGSGVGGGAARGIEFVPEDESRALNIAKGTGEGALLPALLRSPEILMKAGAKINAPFKNLNPLKEEIGTSKQAIIEAKENERLAKEVSNAETGMSSPGKMKFSKEEKLKSLETLPERPNETIEEIISSHEGSKKELKELENDLGIHLNKGALHDVRAGARIDETQQKIRKSLSDKFDKVEKNLEGKTIDTKNNVEAKKISDELRKIIKSGGNDTKEALDLLKQLDTTNKNKLIPANDYLRNLRSVRDYARDARSKAYQPGMNAEERAVWQKKYNELDEKADKMSSILESGIGEADSSLLKEANKGWRDKIVPLYRNRIYQNLKKSNKMPENIMKSLRGKETGDLLIKDIIQNDPELLRNVVGQRFANSPHKLHEAGELEQEYLANMPELQELLGKHKNVSERVSHGEGYIPQIQKRNKLESDIAKIDKNLPELKKAAKSKKLSLKQHIEAKNKYEQAKKDKESARNKLKMFTGIGVGGTGIGYGINKINSLFKE